LNRLILVSFYSDVTTELVLAELLHVCCDCVFCNSLVFYVSTFYFFILWAVVSAAYSALLSCSYFERINDDDDDNTTNANTSGDSDVISFHIYASWFSPPSCG